MSDAQFRCTTPGWRYAIAFFRRSYVGRDATVRIPPLAVQDTAFGGMKPERRAPTK